MCKRVWMMVLLAAVLAAPVVAQAADLADEDYVNRYFGTSMVLVTATQLVDPNQGYWGNLLPQEFMYSMGTLVDIVNKARRDAGRTDMLNPADWPISVGGETKREDGKWEYNIDFRGCTPPEVQLVMDGVKFTGALNDCQHEMRPLRMGYFNGQSQDFNSVTLNMQGTSVTLTSEMSMKEMLQAVNEALKAKFGENYKTDIYFSANDAVMGGKGMYINITVYLDGAENQFNYGMEGSTRGVC